MPIVAAIKIPFPTKDPREAVGECVRLVRTNATTLEPLQIKLGLGCMANAGVLLRLAERLPPTALGFTDMGSVRARSAGQFKARASAGYCSFHGNLTEHFSAIEALKVVEQLFESPPQAIRSTAFHLDVENIQWRGSPPGSQGSLNLFDFKAFKRAGRFALSATVQLRGEDPKSPELKDTLKRVTNATGLAFDKGFITRELGEKGQSPAHAQAALVGQICFEEAIEDIAAQLPKHWISEFSPEALSDDNAFRQRLKQWGEGSSGKVNLPAILKRTIKEALPELVFDSSDAEQVIFKRRLGAGSEIIIVFDKSGFRLGKTFTLVFGVRSEEEGMCFTANMSEVERTTEKKTWIYADASEAVMAANEAVNLVKELLPRIEASLRPHFETWPKDLPSGILRHGNLTARQAYELAKPLACAAFADAALIRIFHGIRSLNTRDIDGPELTFDGRLTMNAKWWFHFHSPKRDASFEVTVPSAGRIRMLDHGKQYQNPNARHHLVPAGEDWMDSDKAFALAEERGGRERRNSGETFGVATKLMRDQSNRIYWAIRYLVTDERGRNDLIVNLDANTGEPRDDIRGY